MGGGMEMNRRYGLILLLCINHALYTQSPQTIESLDRHEKNFMRDVRLINKCYLTKAAVCNANEQALAQNALRSAGIKVGLILAALAAGTFIHYQYRKAMEHGAGQKETAYERHVRVQQVKERAKKRHEKQAAKSAQI